MGRRRSAVYVFGTGEPVMSDCPGSSNSTRAERKPSRPSAAGQAEREPGEDGRAKPPRTYNHGADGTL